MDRYFSKDEKSQQNIIKENLVIKRIIYHDQAYFIPRMQG